MATTDLARSVPEALPADQQRKILDAADPWSTSRALSIVRSDWAYAETYRTNAHDWRYRNADELYLAWAGQRYWDGTRVPRSSLGIYVVFEQIESLLPKMVSLVTGYDNYHFTSANPGDPDNELICLAWREHVLRQLDEIDFREQVRRAIKSSLIYGNGVIECGVEEYSEEQVLFDKRVSAKAFSLVNHPAFGPIPFPTQVDTDFRRQVKSEKKIRPYARYVSVKDFYMDPNSESTRPQDAGYVMKRVYMRAEQLKSLKGREGFNIPGDEYLTDLSKSKSTANQDVTKLSAELFRYNMWNPSLDYTSAPEKKRIAVVEYTTRDRKIWWLHGGQDEQSIIYNQPNPYGCINYFSSCYADVPDRWNALSVSDVAEGEQRLQQAVINGRVDELALALHPRTIKRRGVTIPAYQLKRRPGVVIETESPGEDILTEQVQNITEQAYVEVNASQVRVERITGQSSVAGSGVAAPGGNSANRTAAGINVQAGAADSRVKYQVENIENDLIEPIVNFFIKLDKKFMNPKQASAWLTIDPRFRKLDPVKVFNARVSANCRASTKMAARMGFLQIFPMLAQVFFNPEFLQLLAQQRQETLNTKSVFETVFDAINYSPREPWITQMSPQQVQAMQQPPADVLAKLQMQQQQTESDQQINQNNLQTKLIDTLLKQLIGAHTKHAELDDTHNVELLKLLVAANQPKPEPGNGNGGGASKTKTSSK